MLIASPEAAAKKPPAPAPEFEPLAELAPHLELRRDAWVQQGPEITLILRELKNEERQAYLKKNIGLSADPFAARPNATRRYSTFLLIIENRSEQNIVFNPRTAWLKTKHKIFSPIGMTDLQFDMRVLGHSMPPAYEKIKAALFEQSVTVRPGTPVSGLLAYRPIPPKTRSFNIDLRIVDSQAEVIEFTAPYTRVKPAKNRVPKENS